MAILEDCQIWFAKIDPKHPNGTFNKDNPTWEMQIRTTDRAKSKEWASLGMKVAAVIPEEDGATPYFKVNLRKRSMKADKSPADPVEVIDGDLNPMDPTSIGNGSIGNVNIFVREYDKPGQPGVIAKAAVLMGVQLTKHIMYTPPKRESFKPTKTERIPEGGHVDPEEDDDDHDPEEQASEVPSAPVDKRPDVAF